MGKTENIKTDIFKWFSRKFLQISVFNAIMIVLFLLRSAGYFEPYFLISVNFIVIIGLLLAIVFLRANSKAMFVVSLLFWVFAGSLRVLNLDVWAERTAIYTYQALLLGVVLLIFETLRIDSRRMRVFLSWLRNFVQRVDDNFR